MIKLDFSKFQDETTISTNFHILKKNLDDLLTGNQEDFYEVLHIPKANKSLGYRKVYKPNWKIDGLHKYILEQINFKSKPLIHDCAHGFIKGKSILTNAQQHLNKKYLLQVDIKSFFSSISQDEVKRVFIKLGCNDYVAELFSILCTINNSLAEGLNTSPTIANIYFFELDEILNEISRRYSCTYTRYADDLTFSSNNYFDYTELLKEIEDALEKKNLTLNNKKTRFSKYGQAQYVTGLSISNEVRPRIPKKIKKRLRQEFYFIKKYGFNAHFSRCNQNIKNGHNRLNGWLLYALNVEPDYFRKLYAEYKGLK
ncbi:reverse transcriptase family protein [Aliarcobacter butzleri]|uniref:reverse transcriptase family protein n=1 Tax=Aliarcobacter butzleri TaxID=28197 RepID=UPI001EDADD22|nr:reverse transcriptase family protein [Aliarcobacter butzleri]MCG3678926.1 reverse transcriptase family protein [Aliarcobacter butzleri]MDY0193980.1 reverse transcriptase family protein [Aliarcobacter butzleri]